MKEKRPAIGPEPLHGRWCGARLDGYCGGELRHVRRLLEAPWSKSPTIVTYLQCCLCGFLWETMREEIQPGKEPSGVP